MRIDIGFGDVVYPGPEESELPTMLDFPAPRLLCYSRESSIAEKLEAMVKLKTLNSRMKDFYDIWLLSRQFDFHGVHLAEAIRRTFEQRDTLLPEKIEAFTPAFTDAKEIQWRAFRKRLQSNSVPESFREIITTVDEFITPIFIAVFSKKTISAKWIAPGPWR
jgi:hypothetical protein